MSMSSLDTLQSALSFLSVVFSTMPHYNQNSNPKTSEVISNSDLEYESLSYWIWLILGAVQCELLITIIYALFKGQLKLNHFKAVECTHMSITQGMHTVFELTVDLRNGFSMRRDSAKTPSSTNGVSLVCSTQASSACTAACLTIGYNKQNKWL